jgi:hypothetical protein
MPIIGNLGSSEIIAAVILFAIVYLGIRLIRGAFKRH